MLKLKRIGRPPDNFDRFIAEVASGLGELYGPAAKAEYESEAMHSAQLGMGHADVDTVAVFEGTQAVGLLMSIVREDIGRLVFIHVLHAYAGRGVEDKLLHETTNTLRAGGVEGIVSECLPFCPIQEETVYSKLGFRSVKRAIMGAPVSWPALALQGPIESRPLHPDDIPAAAEALVAAYRGAPDRELLNEVQTPKAAGAYIQSVVAGAFGKTAAAYHRVVEKEGRIAALSLSARVAPDVGFLLQIAVHPDFRGKGVGTGLMKELTRALQEDGMQRLALGVTLSNPARRLYARLGLKTWRELTTYVWSRP